MAPTETLKEVIKHRPPVAQVAKNIAEESERDKLRQRRRENMQRQTQPGPGAAGGGRGSEDLPRDPGRGGVGPVRAGEDGRVR